MWFGDCPFRWVVWEGLSKKLTFELRSECWQKDSQVKIWDKGVYFWVRRLCKEDWPFVCLWHRHKDINSPLFHFSPPWSTGNVSWLGLKALNWYLWSLWNHPHGPTLLRKPWACYFSDFLSPSKLAFPVSHFLSNSYWLTYLRDISYSPQITSTFHKDLLNATWF